jgi:hypothetical protein
VRYAPDAGPAFQAWMSAHLDDITADLRAVLGPNLIAVILGGGYGRGEGGVWQVDGQDRPYNDLDLFVVVRSRRAPLLRLLPALAHRHERRMGIEVDIGRPLTLADVRAWTPCLMWRELLDGHHVLHGPPEVLRGQVSAELMADLPVIEATRLLLNRGAGLLWALRVARRLDPTPDPDFVRRNRHKCEQALGDALLITYGQHRTATDTRVGALARLLSARPELGRVARLDAYRQALRFKARPGQVGMGQPGLPSLRQTAAAWIRTTLHVEARRTGIDWLTPLAYARWPGEREEQPTSPRARAMNLARGALIGELSLRHPRERLYRELPLLLAEPLPEDWSARGARFLSVWRRFH